jgi:mitogen-activated protein kinase 1/3
MSSALRKGSAVQVYHNTASGQRWIPTIVQDLSGDGKQIKVPIESDWIATDSDRVQSYEYFNFTVHDVPFQIWNRYTEPEFIGQGAYGCVIRARDTQADIAAGDTSAEAGKVAIKKIIDIQEMDEIDSMRTLREIKINRHLHHENVARLTEVFPSTVLHPFNEVYMVFDLETTDLSRLIRADRLRDEQIPLFSYQLMKGMKYIHTAGIMHRDIKPSNLLVNPVTGVLKLADFGLAIGKAGTSHQLINYVVTRWYRAPELLLDNQHYDYAIDMWSVGCIVIEMLIRKPLLKGKTSKDQLRLIMSLLGNPAPEDVAFIEKERYREMLLKMSKKDHVPWEKVISSGGRQVGTMPNEDVCISLIDQLLQFAPEKRLTAQTALEHPYFEGLHNPANESACESEWGFVTEDLDVEEVFKMLQAESLIMM